VQCRNRKPRRRTRLITICLVCMRTLRVRGGGSEAGAGEWFWDCIFGEVWSLGDQGRLYQHCIARFTVRSIIYGVFELNIKAPERARCNINLLVSDVDFQKSGSNTPHQMQSICWPHRTKTSTCSPMHYASSTQERQLAVPLRKYEAKMRRVTPFRAINPAHDSQFCQSVPYHLNMQS
jgi:hypothetical protein